MLLYVLSVFGFLLLGSALSSAFRPASSTNKTSSVITIRSHAESWTASESEAVYRVGVHCVVYRKMSFAPSPSWGTQQRAARRRRSLFRTTRYQS